MKLFLVERTDGNGGYDEYGTIGYDEYGTMVVRAKTAKEAKEIACDLGKKAGDRYPDPNGLRAREIPVTGKADVILAEFHAG